MMKGKIKIYGLIIVIALCFCNPWSYGGAEKVMAAEETMLHEENFSTDHNLKGLFASCEEYFQAGDWKIEKAELKLYYTVTTLVREEVSDFTVSLNGTPVFSQKIPLTAGETQEFTISLPKRLIKEGANSIRIESYIRTNETDPCEDDISGASWMVIRGDSYVSMSYQPAAICGNVAEVYEQLTSIEGLENKKSSVYIPSEPTEAELTSASYVLSGISQNAALFYDNLALKEVKQIRDMGDSSYGVFIGEYDRLPIEISGLLNEEQIKAAQNGAVIVYEKMVNGQDILIVTGKKEQALERACRLFGNKDSMMQTKATWRKISETEDVNVIDKKENTILLTKTGSYLSGPFIQNAAFAVPIGASKSIAAGSKAEIHFRYAQNLDFDRSLVTVYAGDTPLGSKRLEKDSANGDVLLVDIPDNLELSGSFQLNVTFDLELKDLVCDMRRQDMPWAYVTNESTVSLNTKEVPGLLFDYYPSPFVYEGKWNNAVFILPTKESFEDLDAMRKILLTMGRYQTSNAGNIRVCRADNIGDIKASNIISIGALAVNPIVQQNNDQLYFRFSPQGTTIRSNEKMKIEPNYGATLGTAQLLYSIYSPDKHALLVVSGVTDEGMMHAADYLGNIRKNWEIYGDGFVTDGEQINCYRFGTDNEKTQSFLYDLTEQNSMVIFLITGTCVLLLLVVSLIMIWNKHRKGK